MEAAEQGRTRYVVLADRVARAYAPVVHSMALASFVGWMWLGGLNWHGALMIAVSVLIITCPCALALAIPVVQVIATSRLMRSGIFLKSGSALERLAGVDRVLFDKTGTLTLGRPALMHDPAIIAADLQLAASLAVTSHHPLSQAIVRAAPAIVATPGVIEHAGAGLSLATPDGEIRLGNRRFCSVPAAIDSIMRGGECVPLEIWMHRPGRAPVCFRLKDRLRRDAEAVVLGLRARGLSVAILSGDREAAVAEIARTLHIEEWEAALRPAEKVQRLQQLAAAGSRVLMVGDGLNDAPALSAAYISASPTSAADISQNGADVVFQGEDLQPVLLLLDVARLSDRIARENLALALGYNLLAVPMAIAGLLTPLIAAIAMSSSSLLVIGNALRLARGGGR